MQVQAQMLVHLDGKLHQGFVGEDHIAAPEKGGGHHDGIQRAEETEADGRSPPVIRNQLQGKIQVLRFRVIQQRAAEGEGLQQIGVALKPGAPGGGKGIRIQMQAQIEIIRGGAAGRFRGRAERKKA